METLKLRFESDAQDLPLAAGVHDIGRVGGRDGGLGPTSGNAAVRFCVDRRGVWLTVPEGGRSVHVNGRQVRRMAMLRVGDAIFVEGTQMRLVAARPPGEPPVGWRDGGDGEDGAVDARTVLRGVGGRYHGRSFTLERPRLVGRAVEADIRIDEPAFADRHARLEMFNGEVVLRDLGSADGSEVNGETVRDALLRPGDQVVFDAHHRFVVEAPARAGASAHDPGRPVEGLVDGRHDPVPRPSGGSALKLPWLLLAALVLAGLLAALLLFGTG